MEYWKLNCKASKAFCTATFDDKIMSLKINAVLVSIAVILLVTGCIEETSVKSSPTLTPTPTPTPSPTREISSVEKPTSPIPEDYYSQRCSLPADVSLIDWLTMYVWKKEYEDGSWDCSQMVAAVEQQLESCGYDAIIQAGENHAWILVYLTKNTTLEKTSTSRRYAPKDGYYLYEATNRYFPIDSSEYQAERQFNDIHDVWDYYSQFSDGREGFLREWGWWVVDKSSPTPTPTPTPQNLYTL